MIIMFKLNMHLGAQKHAPVFANDVFQGGNSRNAKMKNVSLLLFLKNYRMAELARYKNCRMVLVTNAVQPILQPIVQRSKTLLVFSTLSQLGPVRSKLES